MGMRLPDAALTTHWIGAPHERQVPWFGVTPSPDPGVRRREHDRVMQRRTCELLPARAADDVRLVVNRGESAWPVVVNRAPCFDQPVLDSFVGEQATQDGGKCGIVGEELQLFSHRFGLVVGEQTPFAVVRLAFHRQRTLGQVADGVDGSV